MTKGNPRKTKDNRTPIITAAITATLGCVGTVAAAIIGYLGVQAQINKPISITQTAQAYHDIETIKSASTFVGILDARISLRGSCLLQRVRKVIPSNIEPNSGIGQSEINTAIASNDNQWAIGPNSPILLELTNTTTNNKWIRFNNTLKIVVNPLNSRDTEDANILEEIGGCGGVEIKQFPYITFEQSFDEYTQSVEYVGFDYFTLQPGEGELFILPLLCANPGVYGFSIEITGTFDTENKSLTITNIPPLVCPKSFDLWTWDGGLIFQDKSYIWNGDNYSPK